jgi:hypothetical protein
MAVTKPLIVAILLAASFAVSAGQVYKWVDPSGKVRFSDMPQAGWKRVDPATGTVASEIKAEPDVGSEEEPDQTAAVEEPADSDAAEEVVPKPPADQEPSADLKASECKRRKDQLATYEGASRIVEKDAKGQEKSYSEIERLKLIERTRKQVKELCG